MNFDRVLAATTAGIALMLSACSTNAITEKPGDLKFGDANRQTMMAQVINPDPVYTEPAQGNGANASDAVERYRTDKVKQPDTIRTTDSKVSQPQAN